MWTSGSSQRSSRSVAIMAKRIVALKRRVSLDLSELNEFLSTLFALVDSPIKSLVKVQLETIAHNYYITSFSVGVFVH